MIRNVQTWNRATRGDAPESLAFARGDVRRAATRVETRDAGRAFTIAVTAPRTITCKRGVAAHLGAHLADFVRGEGSSVCVVDLDLDSRDLGIRLGVDHPTVFDLASLPRGTNAEELARLVPRLDGLGLSVLPTRRPADVMLPLLQRKSVELLPALRTSFDFVVIDAPVGVGVQADQWQRDLLREIDVLVVAVSADPAAAGGMLRYLSTLTASRDRGGIPKTFEVHVVLTGSDEDNSRTLLAERELDRALRGISVISRVPQLWGRGRPELALGVEFDPEIRRPFAAMVDFLTRVAPPSP